MSSTRITARRFSWRVRLCGIVFGLILGWFAAELLLTLAGLPSDDLVFLNKDGSLEWDCYCSNPRGYFVERRLADGRIVYCVNHAGDPDREVNLFDNRMADAYKIVTVGDSFTWGLGVEYRHSFPYRLRERLETDWRRSVALSNHAHVGRMITEIREEMAQALASGVPDLCIYGYVLNDPVDLAEGRRRPVAPATKAAGMDTAYIDDFINIRTANLKQFQMESLGGRLRSISRVADLAFRQFEWRQIHARTLAYYRDLYDPVKNRAGLETTLRAIAEMRQLQAQAGKRFLVVVFPLLIEVDADYPFADIHRMLAEQLRHLGVEHLDLLPVFRRHKTCDLCVHPLDRHPNELAHELAADAIAGYLTQSTAR